jgi:hypothetical protein
MRGLRVRSIASLLLAGFFVGALVIAAALPASSQCYPGLACPTDQQQQKAPEAAPLQPQPGGGARPGGATRGGAEYHYVGDVRPPDDYLSLRTVPSDKGGARIMKMPAGTLFKVTEKRGVWWHVVLRDGQSGWAHSNWIVCCKTVNE